MPPLSLCNGRHVPRCHHAVPTPPNEHLPVPPWDNQDAPHPHQCHPCPHLAMTSLGAPTWLSRAPPVPPHCPHPDGRHVTCCHPLSLQRPLLAQQDAPPPQCHQSPRCPHLVAMMSPSATQRPPVPPDQHPCAIPPPGSPERPPVPPAAPPGRPGCPPVPPHCPHWDGQDVTWCHPVSPHCAPLADQGGPQCHSDPGALTWWP